VERVLSDYLRAEGFRPIAAEKARVELRRDDNVLLGLSYYEEEGLPHALNVALGIQTEQGAADMVGLWAVIPPDAEAQSYALWRFATAVELDATLVRLQHEVLAAFAAPMWSHPGRLADVLARERASRAEAHARSSKRPGAR
jgi:hypothetical protein